MVLALQFAPSTFVHLKWFVSTYDIVPPSIGIKTNFFTVPYLRGSWLNIIETKMGDHISMKGCFFSSSSCDSLSCLFTFLAFSCSEILVISISELLSYLFLISQYLWWIFWNMNQANLVSLCFALLWIRHKTCSRPRRPLFYTRSHFSALQNCALIFSTNFQFIFTFKNA